MFQHGLVQPPTGYSLYICPWNPEEAYLSYLFNGQKNAEALVRCGLFILWTHYFIHLFQLHWPLRLNIFWNWLVGWLVACLLAWLVGWLVEVEVEQYLGYPGWEVLGSKVRIRIIFHPNILSIHSEITH